MNFCNLDEAWGGNFTSQDFHNSAYDKKIKEHFKPLDKNNNSKSHFNSNCDNILNHVLSCPKCMKKIKKKFL